MKRFIFVGFLSCIMTLGVALMSFASSEKNSIQSELGKYNPVLDLVYINDAITPDVSPNYGKCFFVNAKDVKVSGFSSDITPTANSPPANDGITGVLV